MLVKNERYYQLHQFLQYHVIGDSVHVACQLLSLEGKYPPALQLALDMLKRLNESERIVEVLLVKKQLLAALRFVQGYAGGIRFDGSRFLDVAKDIGDPKLFITTFKFLEQRKALPTGAQLISDIVLSPQYIP